MMSTHTGGVAGPSPALAAALAGAMILLAPAAGVAQSGDYFDKPEEAGEMSYRVDNPRSTRAWVVIGSLGGGALVSAGIGVLFQLSGDGLADDVEAKDRTGLLWTEDRQDTYDSARFRRGTAMVFYGVGAGLAVASLVAYLRTNPGSRLIRVGSDTEDSGEGLTPSIAPLPGGGIVGGRWRF